MLEDNSEDSITIVNPSAQIRAWINNTSQLEEFWKNVLFLGSWESLGKSEQEVNNLVGYFGG